MRYGLTEEQKGVRLLCSGIIFGVIGLSFMIILIVQGVRVSYQYENEVEAHWQLADKSSTITAKAGHIDEFVASLERSNLRGTYNAIIFKTPDNSFDNNFTALKTLQARLHEIQGMNVASLEYQQAINQITAQEQGEANAMLSNLKGAWYLKYHAMLWEWIFVLNVFGILGLFILAAIYIVKGWNIVS